ncbi:MAG TPA: DUF1521 domain-containing protein [Myxococcaceae bacterium]|jgi:hypothetical protein
MSFPISQLSLPNFNFNFGLPSLPDLVGQLRDFRFPDSSCWREPARRPDYDPCRCYCPEPPPPCPAPNPLQTGCDGKIHTPGGYTIEADGNTKWKITGPDGKCTTISGDPHVHESDGGKWDFKRNSSFVLPDGTKINVQTKPVANGMTVTSGLEVVNGNNRVEISGVNTAHPHTSQVQHTGQQWNTAGWDKFVMGNETDDWAFGGREIVGSEKGGEVLKVGNPLAPGHYNPTPAPGPTPGPVPGPVLPPWLQQMAQVIQQMLALLQQLGGFTRPTGLIAA